MEEQKRSPEVEQLLANVERASDACVVTSRYGFRKVEYGGKFYLEAMSKDELLAELDGAGTDEAKEIAGKVRAGTFDDGGCIADNSWCVRLDPACRTCHLAPAGGGGYLCYCVH